MSAWHVLRNDFKSRIAVLDMLREYELMGQQWEARVKPLADWLIGDLRSVESSACQVAMDSRGERFSPTCTLTDTMPMASAARAHADSKAALLHEVGPIQATCPCSLAKSIAGIFARQARRQITRNIPSPVHVRPTLIAG